jgi:N-acetylmuramoyl-L-alanine amidase
MNDPIYIPRIDPVKLIVIHSSATPPHLDVGRDEIREWHMERGFVDVGYHWIIRRNATIEAGRPPWANGAHCRGVNQWSLGICLVGGTDSDGNPDPNFTEDQLHALRSLLIGLSLAYPTAVILGHRDVEGAHTECPSFNVRDWWQQDLN